MKVSIYSRKEIEKYGDRESAVDYKGKAERLFHGYYYMYYPNQLIFNKVYEALEL